jgi:hypothetical protein
VKLFGNIEKIIRIKKIQLTLPQRRTVIALDVAIGPCDLMCTRARGLRLALRSPTASMTASVNQLVDKIYELIPDINNRKVERHEIVYGRPFQLPIDHQFRREEPQVGNLADNSRLIKPKLEVLSQIAMMNVKDSAARQRRKANEEAE